MKRGARATWEMANRLADCDCYGAAENMAPTTAIGDWAVVHEYWNLPTTGHAIMASLTLDGLACEDLP